MDRSTVRSVLEAVVRYWWLGALALLSVMAATAYFTWTRQPTYLARASLLISPSNVAVDSGQLVYSIDTLGRGRVFGTYTEVLGSDVVHREALQRLGIPVDQLGRSVVIKSAGLADTAVVQVSVESRDPELSAVAANVVGEIGIGRLQQLYPLYNLSFLNVATPPTRPYTPDPIRNLGLGLLFGLTLAVLIPWLVDTIAHRGASRQADWRTQVRDPHGESLTTKLGETERKSRPPAATAPRIRA